MHQLITNIFNLWWYKFSKMNKMHLPQSMDNEGSDHLMLVVNICHSLVNKRLLSSSLCITFLLFSPCAPMWYQMSHLFSWGMAKVWKKEITTDFLSMHYDIYILYTMGFKIQRIRLGILFHIKNTSKIKLMNSILHGCVSYDIKCIGIWNVLNLNCTYDRLNLYTLHKYVCTC